MNTRSIGMVAVALSLVTAACGSNVETPGEGGSGGTGTTTSTTGGTGGSTGGAGGACAAFNDQDSQKPLKVVFRNQTSQPVYVPGSCSDISYHIKPLSGDDGTTYAYDTSCLQTCQELQTSYPYDCGACPQFTYKIEPNGTFETVWDGTHIKYGVDMPDACWFDGPSLDTCGQILAAAAGGYRIDAEGYAECQGDCQCDAMGRCTGSPGGFMAYPDPAKFMFPADDTIEIVFGFCAFGCPAD